MVLTRVLTRSFLVVVVAWLAIAGCASGGSEPASARPGRPNIILVLTDDQRFDAMADLSAVDAMEEWARFDNAFVNLPQCCPSRATILTGQYSHHTKVETNFAGELMDDSRTIATMLGDEYHTGFVGKYVNLFPFGRPPFVPPGWDEWASFGKYPDYYNYDLIEDGVVTERGSEPDDYSTDVFAAKALDFLETAPETEPFFLFAAFFGPHDGSGDPPVGAPRHEGACADRPFDRRPNFNAYDEVSEPAWMGDTERIENAMSRHAKRACEALQSVDEAVVSMVELLEETDRLDDTYIVFMSDNGYSHGEHRLTGKGHLYEESIHVPLLVRGPDVDAGSTVDRLTSNVDLVPTILDWAGLSPPPGFLDGSSFAAAARGDSTDDEPDAVLLRGCRHSQVGGGRVCGGYKGDLADMGLIWGLRTLTHKYVEYEDGYLQLFDLQSDPYELHNLAPDPDQRDLVLELHARLDRRRGPLPAGPIDPPPAPPADADPSQTND